MLACEQCRLAAALLTAPFSRNVPLASSAVMTFSRSSEVSRSGTTPMRSSSRLMASTATASAELRNFSGAGRSSGGLDILGCIRTLVTNESGWHSSKIRSQTSW